ncbi:MAG: amino acid permease [Alphaproteobacteria bacterium]|nr:amino acid permease [Alphaproteobacteria bacterium]
MPKRYLIKKPIDAIIAEAKSGTLKRHLGPLNLVSLGIGAIIGAGIFVMTGTAAAEHAGPAIVLSFILAGFACALTGLCYAELASMLPVSGSAYTYSYASLGEVCAWIMGWLLVLEYGVSAATVAVGWSGYVQSFLKDFGIFLPPQLSSAYGDMVTLADGTQVMAIFNLPAFLAICGITAILIRGVKESATVNNIIVFTKLIVVVTFIIVGANYINPDNWHPFIPESTGPGQFGMGGIAAAAGVIFFAYIGFEAVSTAAQEARNPQKDVPIGILGSLIICTILYILVAGVLTGVVHYSQLGVPDPIAVGVDNMGLPWLSFVVKVGAIMGLTSVMLVTMYGQTRVFYIMSKDGLLPPLFSKVHPKFHTPHLNTMTVGLGLAIAAALTPISVLGNLVSMGTLTAFAVVCFSVIYLRRVEPDLERPFRCPGMPWVPLVGIGFCLYLISSLSHDTLVSLLAWFFIGLAVYFGYSQFHSKLRKQQKA